MFRKSLGLLAALACLGISACTHIPASPPVAVAPRETPPLILVSIDGFRADYLYRGVSPNLSALAAGGATGIMRPSFPSITFPNHYTLVTGKVPDHTGIVANTMRDPQKPDVIFKMSNAEAVTDGFWWDEALPMWDSVVKAGGRSAVEFWPGSEAAVQGLRPTYYTPFDSKVTNEARVDQILAWLDLPADQRPRALLLYFDIVDHEGHDFGPDSPQVNVAVGQVDSAIGRLRDGLKARGVDANLIIVADHGMSAISKDRAYFLEDYLPEGSYDPIVTGPVAMINATPGHEADLDKLTHMTFDHMICWHKADIPKRLKFGTNPRVPEVVCGAEQGWLISVGHEKGIGYKGGAHGYDPKYPDMNALFVANGPGIRAGVKLKPFDNVDVYPLTMHLLDLTPEPGDGSLKGVRRSLK